MTDLYTTAQVADRIGLKPSRVRQLCLSLNLGQKIGRDRLLSDADVAVMERRNTKHTGRPKRPPDGSI